MKKYKKINPFISACLSLSIVLGNFSLPTVLANDKGGVNLEQVKVKTEATLDNNEAAFDKINSSPKEIKNLSQDSLVIKKEKIGLEKSQQIEGNKKNYVEGEILIKYKNNKINLQTASGRVAALNFIRSKSLEKKEDLRKNNISVLRIKDAKTVEQKVAELKNDPNVEYAEPNYKRYPAAIDSNDTYKNLLWGLDNTGQEVGGTTGTNDADIDAPEAWAISEGSSDIVVAVIDSGVAYNHPDIASNMWDGTSCKDESGNAFGGCNNGYDYEDNDKTPLPTDSSHGTHIAGTIGAVKNNDKGIMGVAPNVKIMAIKFGYDTASEVKAIDFAINNGAEIINASFTGTSFSQTEYDAIGRFQQAGGVFVAAAGNSSANNDGGTHSYPSDYDLDNIISVAAMDQNDNLAAWSSYGAISVDVGAPGTNIYSTVADSPVMSENFNSVTAPNLPSGWVKGGITTNNWIVGNDGSSNVVYSDKTLPYAPSAYTWIMSSASDLSSSNIKGATLSFTIWCDTPPAPVIWQDYIQTTYYNGAWNNGQKYDEDKIHLDGGSSWTDSGHSGYYKNYTENVSAYLSNNFRFTFDWHTDSSIDSNLGCTIDDVKITKFSDGSDEQYNYGYMQGTSMATPHVAGLAALIEGYNPNLTPSQIKNIILTTGDDIASLHGKTSAGTRINAQKALQAANPAKAITAFSFTSPAATGVIDENAKTIAVTVPLGTSKTALIATFITTGSLVKVGATTQTSGITANDFTNPVTYTVTAVDGSFQNYVVTITVYAGMEISGNITQDTTWTLANSPYIVTGTIQVLEGVKLTIEPGVTVKFNTNTGLNIGGELIASGTADSIITFTSNQSTPNAGDWIGIKFFNTAIGANFDSNNNYINGSVVKYTKIAYAGGSIGSQVALDGGQTALYIDNNIIELNKWKAIFINKSQSIITNNTIRNNSLGTSKGDCGNGVIEVYLNNHYIENNIIDNNSLAGITLNNSNNSHILNNEITNNGCGIKFYGSNNEIKNNIIDNNSSMGIYYYSGSLSGAGNVVKNNSIKSNGNTGIYFYKYNNSINKVEAIYNNIFNNINYNFWLDDSSANIDVINNYWGTMNNASIANKIYDYYDLISLGKVNYEPYATEELNLDDQTAPTLAQVTPVTTPTSDNTPSYTFSSNEAGTITYGGSCSGATTAATAGNNTITFNTLADGTYSNCTIKVTDAMGNESLPLSVTAFTVNTTPVDTTAPVITLLGSTPVNLYVGDTYTDAGATASDDVDGNITADIVTNNPVNINTVGTYTVTYNVSDTAGNSATQVTRTVNVFAAPTPSTIYFFNNTTGLINGDTSQTLSTSGYRNLSITRYLPTSCTEANTALALDASFDGSNWIFITNLCSESNPTSIEVSAPYYRIRISFMNILDNNPKPAVTVHGYLSEPINGSQVMAFFNQASGLINGSISPIISTNGFDSMFIGRYAPEDCVQTNTALQLQSSTDGNSWVSVANLCDYPHLNEYDINAPYYRIRISFMNILDNNPKPPVTVNAFLVPILSSNKVISSFSFTEGVGVINESNHTITVTVPFGTDVTALMPTIATSINATVSPVSGAAQDFTSPVTYTVTATDSSTQEYVVTVTVATNPDIAIVAADKAALVDDSIKGANSDLSNITGALTNPLPSSSSNGSTITWASSNTSVVSSDGQTINRPAFASGNATVTMTATITKGVVAETKAFTLTVIKLPASTVATITSATYTVSAGGTISETITNVPYGTSKTDFLAALTKGQTDQTWDSAGISDPVVTGNTLVVTAQDGITIVAYTITAALNPAKAITSFNFASPEATGVINEGAKTIAVTVPFGTVVTDLAPTIVITGASVSPASGVAQDFTSPVTYTVTATDSSAQEYTVTVTVVANSAKAITSFNFEELNPVIAGVINGTNISLGVSFGTNVTALVPTIVITGASVSPASGAAQDFTSPATYTVTAADSSTQAYTVTVTVIANPDVPVITSVATDGKINNTEKNAIHIIGTAEANSLVTVTLTNGANSKTGTQQLSGGAINYDITIDGTVALPASLVDGTINVSATATNSVGGVSASTTTTATQDIVTPTVTKIGDDSADVVLSVGDTDLVFSEELSTDSKTAVQNALTAGADKTLIYTWSGGTLTINATETTTFANDVIVSTVSDIAGNALASLLIIDSSLTATQIAPDGSGDATVNNTTPQVVITNPTQAVDITISSGTTNPTIDVSSFVSGGTGTLPEINITSANANNATVAIPASTVVTSADVTWNGVIAAPTVTTVTLPVTSGETKTLSTAIEIGFTGAKLSFDKAIRILLVGQAGKRAGYVRAGTTFTEITATCTADNQATGDALAADGDCKIDVGSDLAIWTKHFTSFATYTQTAIPAPTPAPSTGGGGGGGGGGVSVTLPTNYSIKINNNATSTDNRNVRLTLTATNAAMMVVSNEPTFTGTSFETYATTKDWTLGESVGQKTVYVRFRSSSGGTVDSSVSINLTASVSVPLAPSVPASTSTPQGQVLGVQRFAEGAMIRAIGDIDVYIVKYIGSKQFKRLILSPSVFNSYGHLKWENVLDIEKSVVDSFTTSELVRAVKDTKVYKLYPAGDTGQKRWVKTAEGFNRMGFDWDAIYEINTVDRNSYVTGAVIE